MHGKAASAEGDREHDDGEGEDSSPASSLSVSTPGGDDILVSPSSMGISGPAVSLNPSLWKLVERGDTCPFEECAFTISSISKRNTFGGAAAGKQVLDGEGCVGAVLGNAAQAEAGRGQQKNISRCRHFHTLCGCRHTRGALKGLPFQVQWILAWMDPLPCEKTARELSISATIPSQGALELRLQ